MGARTTSATPEGALFALNAPLAWELAGHLAKRVQAKAGEEPKAQVIHLYLLVLSRLPTAKELEIGLKLLTQENEESLRQYTHLMLGLNEFIYVN